MDALSAKDRLKMETARSIREDFLHQLAFHEVDTYTSLSKQLDMMKLILEYYDLCEKALDDGASIERLSALRSERLSDVLNMSGKRTLQSSIKR